MNKHPDDPVSICLQVRALPRRLRDRFKAACARRRTNMTKEIIAFITKYVDKDEKRRNK